ncbi:MAG TPA: hypothetical protein VKE26_12190 [Xanthobacteraceae bacterium]|nr:hypothetical protein [Xanthobacteraceae bacterium]
MNLKLVTATVLASALAATVISAPASAGVNGRQLHQQYRILKGVANGSLTAREFVKLEKREAFIRREERLMRAAHGGTLTPFDRAVLNARLNATSNAIWNKKH